MTGTRKHKKPSALPPDVKRGRLTPEEKASIEHLAETLTRPTPGAIAQRLNRHRATVNWYMLRHGLVSRRPRYAARAYDLPNGGRAYPFSLEQDRRLTELRMEGKTYGQIAEILTREFGFPRNAFKVQTRAVLLASWDGDDDSVAAA